MNLVRYDSTFKALLLNSQLARQKERIGPSRPPTTSFIPPQQAGFPRLGTGWDVVAVLAGEELGQRCAASFTVSIFLGHRRLGLVVPLQGRRSQAWSILIGADNCDFR